jgi:hypothetical protein
MGGNWNTLMSRLFGLKDDVTPRLNRLLLFF